MIEPHGGKLINRYEPDFDHRSLTLEVELDGVSLSNLYCIGIGAFSPLHGFMGRDDYMSVLEKMKLKDGTVWSLPIVLPIRKELKKELSNGARVKLIHGEQVYGVLEVEETYEVNLELEAQAVYNTRDENHPGVARLMKQSNIYVSGPVTLTKLPELQFTNYQLTPAEVRSKITELGWSTVVGFQTRNPVHRAHEYIQKCALEMVDGLLLHPLVGETKAGDVPADLRMKSYEVLLNNYYPSDRTLLSCFPAAMRYAGPKEAVFHAIVRKNYGCSHFIVGRDHAGVGDYYGTYEAQEIFRNFTKEEIGIELLFFEHAFYCNVCCAIATYKTCPHEDSDKLILSGTKVREMLRKGKTPPPEFSRREVIDVLIEGMKDS
ncbi:sulfate adenylyltransferase [Guptibacillus algicola]|uniref:sulfate adenylyltransferase n=1 Tax=Guptibacillus algicola TaxID=225844 RepID=UPI001CD503AF|nr:sulfate adenylyltransferase [Alkalihalobacillus algicola]MCA0988718.1 sulfate adenylyltransferase [Alkalihalobacillus algicola]